MTAKRGERRPHHRAGVPEATALACAACAALALAAGAAAGHWRAGLAVGLGLLAGAGNGFMARRLLGSGAGPRSTSLGRMLVLSAAGLGLAALLGLWTAPLVLAGIAGAQLALAGVSGVRAVRA